MAVKFNALSSGGFINVQNEFGREKNYLTWQRDPNFLAIDSIETFK